MEGNTLQPILKGKWNVLFWLQGGKPTDPGITHYVHWGTLQGLTCKTPPHLRNRASTMHIRMSLHACAPQSHVLASVPTCHIVASFLGILPP